MDTELNVQELENQKPIDLASNAGISRSQYLAEQNAVESNDAVNKALERVNEESGSMEELMRSLAGESSFRAEAEDIVGVGSTQKRLNELAALSNAETRSLTKDILGNELDAMGTRETRGFLDAKDARARRESAIRSLTIASEAELLQGNLEQAQALVDKAVSAKFEPMKTELEIRKFNLERLDKTLLEPAQKAQAEATKRKLDQQEAEVERQEELVNTITKNQAPKDMIDKVLSANSQEEIYDIPGIGNYLISPAEKLDMQYKNLQIQEMIDKRQAIKDAKEKGLLTDEQLKEATALRKEYNGLQEVKDAKSIQPSTEALLRALKEGDEGSGVGDISAINSFQRLAVDPGVAVREGDVALLQSAQSFGDKAWLQTQGFLKGNKLTDEARQQMRDLALKIHDSRIDFVREQTEPIRITADEQGIDFNKYIGTEFKTGDEINEKVQAINTKTGLSVSGGKIIAPDVDQKSLMGDNWAMSEFNKIQ